MFIHNPNKNFFLNLFNMWVVRNNPAYRGDQDFSDPYKNGSRCDFSTDGYINGEYFRALSNNQYYQIINKDENPKNFRYFVPSDRIIGCAFDPKKQKLVRLEIVKNKKYWIESNQAIEMELGVEPDVVVVDVPIEDLIIPEFVPLPDWPL